MGRFRIFLLVSTLLLIIINIYLSRKYKKLAKSYEANIPEYAATLILFSGLLIFLSSLFFQEWIYRYRWLTLPVRYFSSFYLGTLIYSFLLFIAGDIFAFLGCFYIRDKKIIKFFQQKKEISKNLIIIKSWFSQEIIIIGQYGLYHIFLIILKHLVIYKKEILI